MISDSSLYYGCRLNLSALALHVISSPKTGPRIPGFSLVSMSTRIAPAQEQIHGRADHLHLEAVGGGRRKYRGMDVQDAKRLKQLEEENRRLKTLVAHLTLDKKALEFIVSKLP